VHGPLSVGLPPPSFSTSSTGLPSFFLDVSAGSFQVRSLDLVARRIAGGLPRSVAGGTRAASCLLSAPPRRTIGPIRNRWGSIMIEERVKRTDSVRIKLSPEMAERVEKMAAEYGMPSATFCAFAVGDFVRKSEHQAMLGRMAVMDASRRMGDQFDEATVEKMIHAMIPAMAQAAQQGSLTFDQEEAGKDSH